MFLMMGINDGRKDFGFSQMMLCGHCGRYGTCQVFMTFTMLWLFFIPIARWNKHYYVKMSCCGALYELNPQVGKQIARGKDAEITQADLTYVSPGGFQAGYGGFGNSWNNGYGNGWNDSGNNQGYGNSWNDGGDNQGYGNGWNNGGENQGYGNSWNAGENSRDNDRNAQNGQRYGSRNDNGNQSGGSDSGERKTGRRRCPSCGAMIDRSFAYCPHCGQRLG